MKWLITLLVIFSKLMAKDIEFVVVIPSYNNEKWCIKNLETIVNQRYAHYSVIYINDCSTDNTLHLVQRYITEHKLQDKVKIITNSERRGALANLYHTITELEPSKIVVTCDGDDWLSDFTVLDTLAVIYADKNVWMTYGNYIPTIRERGSCCAPIAPNISKNLLFRTSAWTTSHLRSFYAKLFQNIKKEDLLWQGQFYPVAWDLAMMFPMLEMASDGHFRFIKKVLYIYNIDNPLMDCKLQLALQVALESHIRSLPPYKPLKSLGI